MPVVKSVDIAPLPPERYDDILSPDQAQDFREARLQARELFKDRTVWNVNSTASGGGVAEMLRSLLAYARGAGVDTRWLVIGGDAEFFAITKRIHNHLHDFKGDGGQLGERERQLYEASLKPYADELCAMVSPRDVVLLHDPQTAGLVPALKERGVPVVWRCHVGIDTPSELARTAWAFLIDYVRLADAYVFSRASFVWEGLEESRTQVIAPSIDAFSPKNRDLDEPAVRAILVRSGLLAGAGGTELAWFLRQDGSRAEVRSRADVLEVKPPAMEDRLVLQVSRWDHLKDPLGVIKGFAEHVAPYSDAHLVYAGPAVDAVSDDPEGKAVLDSAIAAWKALPDDQRARVHLATLPMTDGEENAAIVNALQRHAFVVAQKSLAEGFGLTVAEAMWKGRPVVASRIGGIQDQIVDGRTGILLADPADLAAYGAAVLALLEDEPRATEIGAAAREQVRDKFLGARSLVRYLRLLASLLED
ncbi:MAG: glycosyltransferase [Candidatus Dormibacteria bacterium]